MGRTQGGEVLGDQHWGFGFVGRPQLRCPWFQALTLVWLGLSLQMSVLHFLVRRHPGNVEPVKAKEELIFHCGFRRFRASALYSQHTSGGQGLQPRGAQESCM